MAPHNVANASLVLFALAGSPGCLLFGWGSDTDASNRHEDTGSFLNDTSCFPSSPFDCLEAPVPIATFDDVDQGRMLLTAATETAIYLADLTDGAIYEVALPDGPSRKLLDAPLVEDRNSSNLSVGDGRVYYATFEQQLVDTVFVDVAQIRSYTLPAGPEVVLATQTSSPGGPLFHQGEVFYGDGGTGQWIRRPADGSGAPSQTNLNLYGATFDGDTVYFFHDQALAKAPLADLAPITTLTQSLSGAYRIQLDGTHAYVCHNDGSMQLADATAIGLAVDFQVDEEEPRYDCDNTLIAAGSLYKERFDVWDRGLAAYDLPSGRLAQHLVEYRYWGRPVYASTDGSSLYFLASHATESLQETKAQLFRVTTSP